MKILALESSAVACSVALCEDEYLLAQAYQNSALTHSTTLMPMCRDMLQNCGTALEEIDLMAVASGPGSFTGLRIGVAACKGLAMSMEKPCAGVSTLEAMAWQVAHLGLDICPVMDARRSQVYNARFASRSGVPVRLTEDRAISLEELADELKKVGKPQILVGDGTQLCYNAFVEMGLSVSLAPPHLQYQAAWGVARGALELARRGETITAQALVPSYHRLSQAERERLEKENNKRGT